MRFSHLLLVTVLFALTACGGSDRPVYSGHEESTAGVPGFSPDGKRKLAPTVKLGQSYTVGGITYVPRYQPNYDETGMASWYGPGFHGGKTANGERFSTHDYTAAHTTLPMPSIVKVTYLKTGRSAYARVNDRGPFAHGRIIDLSKAVADDIGLSRDGIGKVRVQYMPAESEKFAELISAGRDPTSIDLASEVIGQTASTTQYANIEPADESIEVSDNTSNASPSMWERLNPISSAHAESPAPTVMPPAELPSPDPTDPMQYATAEAAAPIVVTPPLVVPATPDAMKAVSVTPTAAPVEEIKAPTGLYVQLGAFSLEPNAINLQSRFADMASSHITATQLGDATLYRVRMGPFVDETAAMEMLARVQQMGVADAKLVTEY